LPKASSYYGNFQEKLYNQTSAPIAFSIRFFVLPIKNMGQLSVILPGFQIHAAGWHGLAPCQKLLTLDKMTRGPFFEGRPETPDRF
jgi:hypothetical protein